MTIAIYILGGLIILLYGYLLFRIDLDEKKYGIVYMKESGLRRLFVLTFLIFIMLFILALVK